MPNMSHQSLDGAPYCMPMSVYPNIDCAMLAPDMKRAFVEKIINALLQMCIENST